MSTLLFCATLVLKFDNWMKMQRCGKLECITNSSVVSLLYLVSDLISGFTLSRWLNDHGFGRWDLVSSEIHAQNFISGISGKTKSQMADIPIWIIKYT